jgi:hypothetical protein
MIDLQAVIRLLAGFSLEGEELGSNILHLARSRSLRADSRSEVAVKDLQSGALTAAVVRAS